MGGSRTEAQFTDAGFAFMLRMQLVSLHISMKRSRYIFIMLMIGIALVSCIYSCSVASPATGSPLMVITVTSPQNESMTFSQADDIVVAPGAVLHVGISESFDSYAWAVDGVLLAAQASATADIDCTDLALGVHHVSAFVTLRGKSYAKTLRFRIEN